MKSSFCTILLLLCLGLAHGGRGNFHHRLPYFDDYDDDSCHYKYIFMKPNTFMTTEECVKLTCDYATTLIIETCPTLTCNKDEKLVELPQKNDDPYPYCCPKISCRRLQRK